MAARHEEAARRYAGPDAPEDFVLWLAEVDSNVESTAGISLWDLADTNTRDAFDGGENAADYAAQVLDEEGFPG